MSRPRWKKRAAEGTQGVTTAHAAFAARQARRGWCDRLHTAEDVASARAALATWAERADNTDVAARMADDITKRAVALGLEAP
jgi:hypothetical protein